MRPSLLITFSLGLVIFTGTVSMTIVTTSGQAQRLPDEQKPDQITVNTGEVQLDVVVRDKSGRLRKDLTPADFEIYEDGARQVIGSFRLTSVATARNDVSSDKTDDPQTSRGRQNTVASVPELQKSTTKTDARSNVSAVALVFDRLSPDARVRATQAALNYVQESINSDQLFGVFLTDLPFLNLQPFTADHELVKASIQKAGVHSPSLYTSTNAEARATRQILTNNFYQYLNPLTSKEGLPPAQTAPSLTSAAMASLQLGLLERAEEDQRDQLGDATARGLLHIASSLRALPGRKAVIFFSEGLMLPPSVMEHFRAVINAANGNNVSFYTVDAAGLRTESKTAETVKEIESRSEFRMAQLAVSADGDGPMTKALERNEDLLRLNPDSGLGQLAEQTGGFLITDSNDLKGRLQQVDEELHTFYVLSYTSNNLNYDGHFRKIEVKVKRPGLNVQSRKGYFAVKGMFVSPVLSYEAPALAALQNTPKADSFPLYASGFSFPESERMGLSAVLADVPLSAFTFHADPQKNIYDTDFSIVSLLKDQAGQVVDKLSKQYRLSGPLDKLAETKQGRVLFYRQADLAPGRYTLETVAYDAPTGRTSARRGTLEVSATDEGKLRLSDVAILKRAEPASAADEKQSNPFHVGNVIVSPNLGEPLLRSMKEVPFFFVVYPSPANLAGPTLTIELRQQNRTLARMPADLPKPDASGRIQYLGGLPADKLPAGSYELRITVSDEPTTVTRSVYFKIQD